MNPLVIIPARGGSKGIIGKNIKSLGGKPLIQYTIEAARDVFTDDYICVSTDDYEIKKVTEACGLTVPFLRPPELATDEAGSLDVLFHAIEYFERAGYTPDFVILLQPTSPFRTANHIREALSLVDSDTDAIVSVKKTKSNPYSVLYEETADGWLKKSKVGNFTRRQDCPLVWELNGAIYIIKITSLRKYKTFEYMRIKKYPMESLASIDIDTLIDWKLSELVISEKMVDSHSD